MRQRIGNFKIWIQNLKRNANLSEFKLKHNEINQKDNGKFCLLSRLMKISAIFSPEFKNELMIRN